MKNSFWQFMSKYIKYEIFILVVLLIIVVTVKIGKSIFWV